MFKHSATKAVGYVQTARDVAAGAGVLGALGGFTLGKKATVPDPMTPKAKEQKANGLVTSSPPVPRPVSPPPSSSGRNPSRSGWDKWAPVAYGAGAALLAGAAASAVYYKRDDVNFGWSWASDHMKYVKNLWDENALKMRVENLVTIGEEVGVVFRTYVFSCQLALFLAHYCLRLFSVAFTHIYQGSLLSTQIHVLSSSSHSRTRGTHLTLYRLTTV